MASDTSSEIESERPEYQEQTQGTLMQMEDESKYLATPICETTVEQTRAQTSELGGTSPDILLETLVKPTPALIVKKDLPVNMNLPIPRHYQRLSTLFGYLDFQLSFLKSQNRGVATYSLIRDAIEKSTGRQFKMESFQQIIYLVPKYYIYRWEYRSQTKKCELIIEIPMNAKEIVENPETSMPATESMEGAVHSATLELRKQGFKKALLEQMIAHYESSKA
jgi:hypothetical protein